MLNLDLSKAKVSYSRSLSPHIPFMSIDYPNLSIDIFNDQKKWIVYITNEQGYTQVIKNKEFYSLLKVEEYLKDVIEQWNI